MDVAIPEGAAATAVLLHPHPDMGGDRFNHVVSALYAGLPKAGIGVARFDFTSSDLDRCVAETLATIDELATSSVVLVGYSFGSIVAARVGDERITGWCLVAPPIDHLDLSAEPGPKLLIVPEHDFSTPDRVAEQTASWAATTMVIVPGADHFLAGATPAIVRSCGEWLHDL